MSMPELSSSGLPVPAQEEKTMALLAHLAMFCFAGFGPGVIYLMKKDQSPFVAYHAMQALVFQLGVLGISLGAYFVFMVFSMITMGFGAFCFPVLCLLIIPPLLAIPQALKANAGEWAGYPGISGIGRPAGM